MNRDTVLGYCDQIDALTQLIRDEVLTVAPPDPPEPPASVLIPAGDDLQAHLNAGGAYELEATARFATAGGFVFAAPSTSLTGRGDNVLAADSAPAIRVPSPQETVGLDAVTLATGHEVGLLVGRNDTGQTSLDQVPRRVALRAVQSQGHRGKRAIEINGGDVRVVDCEVRDLYDPAGRDSQAIWIGNAPGPVAIEGGYLEAASENILVGGDRMKIPNCRPTGITIRYVTVRKLLAWKVSGGPPVKNLIELKDGHDVLIEHCDLAYSWKSGQDGYCFMFTPTNGASLRNVVVRDCAVQEVGGIVNITGTDASGINTERSQVTIIGGTYRTNKAAMGGSGRFALVTRGPEWFRVENVTVQHDGSSFIDVADKARVDHLAIVGSTWNYGSYGVRIGGYNHGDNSLGQIAQLQIEGNTITGAHSTFRARYPQNTYPTVMREEEEQRLARDAPQLQAAELQREREELDLLERGLLVGP